MALGKLKEEKDVEEVLVKDETIVLDKTVGDTIKERLQKKIVERAKKTEQLFDVIKKLYLDNSELIYMKIRIAEVTGRGLYPEKLIEFFDRKAKKLTIMYDKPKDNDFVDFEGNDFDNFVSMLNAQGLQVLFDVNEVKIKGEPIQRLSLCILPAESTLEEYYVNKIFGKSPYRIEADKFYDMISEERVYIPEEDEAEDTECLSF